jgi:signal transduction histidine kinase
MIHRTQRLLYQWLVMLMVVLTPCTTRAQFNQHQLDSMENLFKTADTPTQTDLSINLALGYLDRSNDRALYFAFKGLHLARTVDSTRLTNAYRALAKIYGRSSNDDSATFYYSKAFKAWPSSNDTVLLTHLNNNYASYLTSNNDISGAVKVLHQNLALLELKDLKEAKGLTLANLASVYFNLERYRDALHFDSLAVDAVTRDGDVFARNKYLINVAAALINLGELDKALPILKETTQYFSATHSDAIAAHCYSMLGAIYEERGDTMRLKEALENAAQLSYKSAYWRLWPRVMLQLADLALAEQNYQQARDLVDQIMEKPSLMEGDWEIQLHLNYVWMKESLMKGNIVAAERYERVAHIAQDSIGRSDEREEVENLEVKYAVEKQEKENELLRKDAAIKDAIIKQQNILNNAGYAGASLFAVMIITLFITAQRRKKGNMLLESTNDAIAVQSLEIEKRSHLIEQRKQELEATLKQLTETQNYLVQSEKLTSLGQFAAGIAQEIGAPMKIVTEGVIHLKQEVHKLKDAVQYNGGSAVNAVVDDIHALTQQIALAASRTAFVVQNLMKVTSGLDGEPVPANLNHCLSSSAIVATTDHPMITIDYDFHELPKVHVVLPQMNQAFLNIMRNAVQAMESTGGVLRIKTQRLNENYVCIWITDTGKGIASEMLPRIFDPFFTTREAGQGAGLGLSIAHSIINKHRGTISIDSEDGKGTSVFIKLPVLQE